VPQIGWQPCHRDPGLQCAKVNVPLDYDAPDGPKIVLALAKHPATHPAERIGSLFINPGGPGGSARGFVPYAAQVLGTSVRQRFDTIGIDPRGIGGSTRVQCVAQPGDPRRPPYPPVAFPRGPRQTAQWFKADDGIRRMCARGANPILDHMTTADTARDMDLIRQAVGDSQLTYYGVSYGTMLGSTYAAMFPGRIRAMVLDGVLDPVDWTTGRFGQGSKYLVSARLDSGYGAWEALQSGLAECDRVGPRLCEYAGSIDNEWDTVVATLHAGARKFQGQRLTYANLHAIILGPLYSASNYPAILDFIDAVYDAIKAPGPRHSAAAAAAIENLKRISAAAGPTPRYAPAFTSAHGLAAADQYRPTFEGVTCSDSVNPADPAAAIPSAHLANRKGPGFGALWSWFTSLCTGWPGSGADAFRGPWRHDTAHPILLTGNLHDPATPISGARAVNKLFPESRLMTLATWGHGAIGESRCVVAKWDRYYVTGRLPASGLVCQPDRPLFP